MDSKGQEDWHFDIGKNCEALQLYAEPSSFCEEKQAAWVRLLNNRSDLLNSLNIDYIHLAIPHKFSLFGRFYDDSLNTPGAHPIRQLSGHRDFYVHNFLDVLGYFEKQKDNYPIFWKSNSLWTPWSCYMSYQLLCSRLKLDGRTDLMSYPFKEIDNSEWYLDGHQQVLGENPYQEAIRQYQFNKLSKRVYANEVVRFRENQYCDEKSQRLYDLVKHNTSEESAQQLKALRSTSGAHVIYQNAALENDGKRVVIFGNASSSYKDHLLTGMLAETVYELHFIDNADIDIEYIRQVRPHCVITQNNEIDMLDVPGDTSSVYTISKSGIEKLKSAVAWYREYDKSANTVYFKGINVDRKTLIEPEIYQLNAPKTIQPGCDPVHQEHAMRSNQVSLLSLDNARLYLKGDRCQLLSGNGYEVLAYGLSEETRVTLESQEYRELPGLSLLLAPSPGSHCYYHWMLDILPKLGFLERDGIDLNSIDHFIVPKLSASFQRETLAHLGINLDKVLETENQRYMRCEKLLHVDMLNGINLKMNRLVPLWLKYHFLTDNKNEDSRLRLYISRPKGVRRGISNEDELLPIIQKAGFEVTVMEGLSVLEQAALLNRAEMILSPHGGALTNMVFCRPGTTVIELFSRHVFPFYYGLSELCGHQYHALLENPESDYPRLVNYRIAQSYAGNNDQWQSQNLDFYVDPKYLETMLEKATLGVGRGLPEVA